MRPAPPPPVIAWLAHVGDAAASRAGFRCVIEHSPTSESTYLHVRRGGMWFGTRVSSHPPAYACSADYAQVLVESDVTEGLRMRLACLVRRHVLVGGALVASPFDVRRAITRLESFLVDRRRFVDRRGTEWRWSSSRAAWECAGDDGGLAPPQHRPPPPITNRVRSAIRHDQNLLARWSVEAT